MIAQHVIFKAKPCDKKELFYRSLGETKLIDDGIIIGKVSEVFFDTYFNLLDINTWEKYTGIKVWLITFTAKGQGEIQICDDEQIILIQSIDVAAKTNFSITIEPLNCKKFVYIKLKSYEELEVSNINFIPQQPEYLHEVSISTIICTYKRNKEVFRNLEILKKTRFFEAEDELYGKLNIHIVDNASEIKVQDEKYIHLYHNPNTGGSGGFTRGMEESVKSAELYNTTHAVLMDDDVEFIPETFYRLYALLSLMKQEYREIPVAGRMFRTDDRYIQYTAVEIWNKGDLKHIGFMHDMTQKECLDDLNKNEGAEYGGWWFCCYPMEFIRENKPMPFFLHCDDVEYGLRCGKTPIILNGIQVWHETYEKRQTPIIAYYDFRNPLFVNDIYHFKVEPKEILKKWKSKIKNSRKNKEYLKEYMIILALQDYLKGLELIKNKDVSDGLKNVNSFSNIILQITVERKYKKMRLKKK